MRHFLIILALSFCFIVLGRSALAQSNYTVTDLGTLGGSYSQSTGINASGQVVGDSITASGASHAFIISSPYSVMTDLGTLGGTKSYGSRINASGQVTGWSYITGDNFYRAFLISPPYRNMTDLGTLVLSGVTSTATGIND
jgi:probable HAF family extracellular repeat protein